MYGFLLALTIASLVGFVFGSMFANRYEITPRYSPAPIPCTTDAECAALNPQYCGGPYEPACYSGEWERIPVCPDCGEPLETVESLQYREAVNTLRQGAYYDGDSYYKQRN